MCHRQIAFFSLAVALFFATGASAQKCDEIAQKGLRQLAAQATVRVAGEPTVGARQLLTLNWTSGQIDGRFPAYLVLSFDRAVRFEGRGFYVLLPNATAPFGIPAFGKNTRAVIPLYGPGAQRQGAIKVRPLQAGALNINWALAAHDRCSTLMGENTNPSVDIRVEATGTPEIVVNPFLIDRPKQSIYSPAGDRVIEIYDGRYRLVDEASRSELADRTGQRPRFSPTGRYVAAYTGNSAAGHADDGMEILDAIDGRMVHREAVADDLAWDNADSFAVVNRGPGGAVAILAPTLSEPLILSGRAGCRACGGTDSAALRVDLDNNVAVYSGEVGVGAASLTTADKATPESTTDIKLARQQVIGFVRRQSTTAAFALPTTWELRGGLKFSNLRAEAESQPSGAQDPLIKFLVKPLMAPVRQSSVDPPDMARVAQWSAMLFSEYTNSNRNILRRLEEFGLAMSEEAKDESKGLFQRNLELLSKDEEGSFSDAETAAMRILARRLGQELPTSSDAFLAHRGTDQHCVPGSANDNYRSGYEKDKRYDRFQRAITFRGDGRIIWLTHLKCRDLSSASNFPSLVFFASNSSPWFLDRETGDPASKARTTCFSNIAFCDFDARIFGDRLLVLSSAHSRAVEIYDLAKRRNVFKKYNLPRGDLLKSAILSPDGRLLLQINSDGSFFGFRLADARVLFEGRYIDDELVVATPDGRFDSTAEGAHYVSLRLPGRADTHTFEQFSAQLKTPALIAKLIAGQTFPPVTLISPPTLSGRIDRINKSIRGTAEVTGNTNLEALFIYQDGLLTHRMNLAGMSASATFEFDSLPGTRWVTMIASDKSGLASVPIGRDLGSSTDAGRRRVHLLSVGVDIYSDPRIQTLAFARVDARRFAEAVGATGENNVIASIKILYEAGAGRDNLLAALQETIASAAAEDTVILFFAGHGIRGADGLYYLATPDTRIEDIPGSALSWKDVAAVLSRAQGRVAVFLDTCHSGAADTGGITTNDDAVKSLLERVPSGLVVFSASKGRELSEETAASGGGLFTSALIDVIAGNRAGFDFNKNGAIEISELYRSVKRKVVSDTEGRQNPWISRNDMIGDFAIF